MTRFALFLITAVLATGCAPKAKPLSPTLEAPIVAGVAVQDSATSGKTNLSVSLEAIKDARPKKALVVSGENTALPENEIQGAVLHSIQAMLEANGFSVSDAAPLVIATEVREWQAQVSGSKINASAALGIQLFDPANKLIYTGKYQGTATLQKPGLMDTDYQETLSSALAEAISQIVKDERLISLISSF